MSMELRTAKNSTTFVQESYPENTWTMRRRVAVPGDREHAPDVDTWKPYDFTNTYPDVRSILLLIGTLGQDITGVELGLFRGESFCTILQVCKNVKKLYGVDLWQPYVDTINSVNENDGMHVDAKSIDLARETALHFTHFSGESHRAEILEMDSVEAADKFEDGSLDFIFMDSYISEEQIMRELRAWYPKIRPGGLFSGHDWHCQKVRNAVRMFREEINNKAAVCAYDLTWAWLKQGDDNATQ